MKIRTIEIDNFRGITGLITPWLEYPNLMVFIGNNGSGKSSVLDAIAMCLQIIVDTMHAKKPKSRKHFSQNDIQKGFKNYTINLGFENDDYMVLRNEDIYIGDHIFGEIASFLSKKPPILAYYRIGGIPNNVPKSIQKYPANELYSNSFGQNFAQFTAFEKWFFGEQAYENAEQAKLKDFGYRNWSLQIVRSALQSFLSEIPGANFDNLRVEHNRDSTLKKEAFAETLTSQLVIDKNGQSFQLSQLSAGEKNMILLVADIARGVPITMSLHVGVTGEYMNIKPEDAEGIILIDEIELHLHPKWQRAVLPALCKTFPNIQFIVTTHSPQVVSIVPNNNVFVLQDGKVVRGGANEGRDTNSILYDLFGEEKRPKAYTVKLHEFYRLLSEQKEAAAATLLAELTEKWGTLDAEIIRANLRLDDLLEEIKV